MGTKRKSTRGEVTNEKEMSGGISPEWLESAIQEALANKTTDGTPVPAKSATNKAYEAAIVAKKTAREAYEAACEATEVARKAYEAAANEGNGAACEAAHEASAENKVGERNAEREVERAAIAVDREETGEIAASSVLLEAYETEQDAYEAYMAEMAKK